MKKSIGFWRCWALVVGSSIGNGIFMLPAVLAPYGSYSLVGWIFAGGGTIFIAMMMGSIAKKIPKIGGPYAYSQESLQHLGQFPGFLVGWGYWLSYWISSTAGAIAFIGYLSYFFPVISENIVFSVASSLVVIWLLTYINLKGVKNASIIQLLTTILKLSPLIIIAAAGLLMGDVADIPARNPDEQTLPALISTMVLITMWAFIGFENGTIAADDVVEPNKTIPKALIVGAVTVTIVYISVTFGIMALIPVEQLAQSTAPFADAARIIFGPWGAGLIAVGAMVSIIGALNGNILVTGMLVRSIALNKHLPKFLATIGKNGTPVNALVVSSVFASVLLLLSFSESLVSAYTILIIMATLMNLIAYLGSTITSFYLLYKDKKLSNSWDIKILGVSILALCFVLFAIIGSGLDAAIYAVLYFIIGIPFYFLTNYLNNRTSNES